MEVTELGSCSAILAGISTKIDGSLKITIEVNPEDQALVSNLLKRYAMNKKLLQVGFVGVDE